jgi:hypothetical protein
MPEEIALRYPTLSLEQIYATITYYWHSQAEVDAYLEAAEEHETRMREEQERCPPLAVKRLREIIQARHATTSAP